MHIAASVEFGFLDMHPGEQVRGYGPMKVAPNGEIYIYDHIKHDLEVYGLDGNWRRTVVLHASEIPKRLDDFAVGHQSMVFLKESGASRPVEGLPHGELIVWRTDLAGGSEERLPYSRTPEAFNELPSVEKSESLGPRPRRVLTTGSNHVVVDGNGDFFLFNHDTQKSYPLIQAGNVLDVGRSISSGKPGWVTSSGYRVSRDSTQIPFHDGEGIVTESYTFPVGALCGIDRTGNVLLELTLATQGEPQFLIALVNPQVASDCIDDSSADPRIAEFTIPTRPPVSPCLRLRERFRKDKAFFARYRA